MELYLLMARRVLERLSQLREVQRDMLIEVSFPGPCHIFLEELDPLLLISFQSMLATWKFIMRMDLIFLMRIILPKISTIFKKLLLERMNNLSLF
jgi:hypothetical protein